MGGNELLSPFIKQCFVTTAVCLNTIGHGTALGLPSILLPQLYSDPSILLSMEAGSWIASMLGLAVFFGNFTILPIMAHLGRKIAHIAVTVPIILSWIIMILLPSVEGMIVARFLQGLSFGMHCPLRSLLIGEYSSPKYRGAFIATLVFSQAFGIFFVHLIGSLLSWQLTSVICLSFSFVSLVLTLYSPESPSWLAAKGRYEDCRRVFLWLRGLEEKEELDEMIYARTQFLEEESVRITHKSSKLQNVKEVVAKKEFYKPIVLMVHLYILSQFAGGTMLANFSVTVITLILGPEANAHFWMVFLDVQRLISNTVAIFVISKVKRRIILFSTGILCIFSHLAIAGYVYAKTNGFIHYTSLWLPVLLLNLQVFTIAFGMIPMPNVICGEVFALEYRSIGNMICFISVPFTLFLLVKTFPTLIVIVGIHGTYLIYACLLTYSLIVAWFMLPETKDKTLTQIEEIFRGRPLKREEITSRESLRKDFIRKISVSDRRCSSPLLF